MPVPSLQDGIDRAGSAVNLLWKPDAPPWNPPVVPPEFVGWAVEQTAPFNTVALSDLSHHMRDLFIAGPDATRLLADHSANNYENFAVGQAKQFVPVTAQGHIVQDGILMRDEAGSLHADRSARITVVGPLPRRARWLQRRVQRRSRLGVPPGRPGARSATRCRDQTRSRWSRRYSAGRCPRPSSSTRTGVSSGVGSSAHCATGWPDRPATSSSVTTRDGEPSSRMRCWPPVRSSGSCRSAHARTRPTASRAAGSRPPPPASTPTRTGRVPPMAARLLVRGPEAAARQLRSRRTSRTTTSRPWELGYGRSISFNHDFLGRDALQAAQDNVPRTKVTLELDADDVREVFGADLDYLLTYGRYRIEAERRARRHHLLHRPHRAARDRARAVSGGQRPRRAGHEGRARLR